MVPRDGWIPKDRTQFIGTTGCPFPVWLACSAYSPYLRYTVAENIEVSPVFIATGARFEDSVTCSHSSSWKLVGLFEEGRGLVWLQNCTLMYYNACQRLATSSSCVWWDLAYSCGLVLSYYRES